MPWGRRRPRDAAPANGCSACVKFSQLTFPVMRPTPYQQARFCLEMGAWGSVPNEPAFLSQGYALRPIHPTLPDLRVVMYVPLYFPRNKSVGRNFDWRRLPEEVGVGFVVQGTDGQVLDTVRADWDVFWKRVAGDGPVEVAQRASSLVLQRLDDLIDDFPELGQRKVVVHLAGHSLGGLVAAAVAVMLQPWAEWRGGEIKTTTFDSPGLVPHYWVVAREQSGDLGAWRSRMVNYLAYPNAINMMHRHLGRIVFLDVLGEAPVTFGWAANCVASSALRAWPWAAAIGQVAVAAGLEGTLRESPSIYQMATALTVQLGNVGPLEVMAGVATYLGLEVGHLMEQHRISTVLRCFNSDEAGEPWADMATEMESWPCYESLGKMLRLHLRSFVEFFVPFLPGNAGVHNLRNRRRFLMSRLERLEGFIPACTMHSWRVRNYWQDCSESSISINEPLALPSSMGS
eukprot:evm.model.scf_777.3 EVM.evm.TU.scf_777.3   scf_777:54464-56834(-)